MPSGPGHDASNGTERDINPDRSIVGNFADNFAGHGGQHSMPTADRDAWRNFQITDDQVIAGFGFEWDDISEQTFLALPRGLDPLFSP